jgi:hypothetical protein
MTSKRIDRKLWALEIDMGTRCTGAAFVTMCERFDELHEMLSDVDEDKDCHGQHRDTGRGICDDCGEILDVPWL